MSDGERRLCGLNADEVVEFYGFACRRTGLIMPRPRSSDRVGLTRAAWPAVDRIALDEAIRPAGLFFKAGRATHWRPDTIRRYAHSWGRYLRYLEVGDLLDPAAAFRSRVTPPRIEAYIALMQLRGLQPLSIATEIEALHNFIWVLAPELDWTWLKHVLRHLKAEATSHPSAAPPAVPVAKLVAAGIREMRRAERQGAAAQAANKPLPRPLQDSIRYRDGLMVALLAVTLLRRRNFQSLALGTTWRRSGDQFLVVIPGNAVKNGKPIEFEVYPALAPFIERYLDWHRVRLLRGKWSDALWVNHDGNPFSEVGLSERIAEFTERHLGVRISPHRFRHCAASSIGESNPELVRIIQFLLVHSSGCTAERYYNKASMRQASQRHGATIEALQAEAAAAS